ncbi:hypothetical protein O181_109819 [Austropuccinia psidii MF-1]|uniref:Uncharacterized protein n=1 Tax=Austropuccinia psidii MF-1 TaxID=1389203 RepID=A0A9Q3JX62_9BASI|nr:hypothetical protein [Austropuccinia psidii MF-1]
MPELPLVPKDINHPAGSNRDIPVSVQELAYGSQAAEVGTSSKSLDMYNELSSSREEFHGPRKYRITSEGLDTHVFQGTSPTDKSLVETPKHVVRGPQEQVGPRKGQQPSGSSSPLQKQKSASKSAKQQKANAKEQSEGQAKGKGKGKIQVEKALPRELQNSQEREDIHGKCVQNGKNSDAIQNKEEKRLNQSFPNN